jgi:hypothetical protein
MVPHQNADTILAAIHKEGCNLISIAYWASEHSGMDITVRQMNQVYWQLVNSGLMSARCLIPLDKAGAAFSRIVKFIANQDVVATSRPEPPGYKAKENEYEILHIQAPRLGHHFLPARGGAEIFDPWEGGSLVTKSAARTAVKINIIEVRK